MSRVVHFEIPCDHPEKTIEFFKLAFGWQFQSFGPDYWYVITGDDKTPGINGGIMKKRDPAQPIANSINVENLDESIIKIEKSGGTIVVPKFLIPTVGWMAYFKDPDGNIHGVFQDDKNAK